MPEVHCGVGRECFLASLHGDNRQGSRDGESGSRHRGGDSFLRRSASSPPGVLSSMMICGSKLIPPRFEPYDCRLILSTVNFHQENKGAGNEEEASLARSPEKNIAGEFS